MGEPIETEAVGATEPLKVPPEHPWAHFAWSDGYLSVARGTLVPPIALVFCATLVASFGTVMQNLGIPFKELRGRTMIIVTLVSSFFFEVVALSRLVRLIFGPVFCATLVASFGTLVSSRGIFAHAISTPAGS